MAAVPLQRAFDLTPGYELRLGPKPRSTAETELLGLPPDPPQKVYPVPPLTLGRFMDVMACDWALIMKAVAAAQPPLEEKPADEPEKLAAQIGKSLVYFPAEAFAPLVAAAVPGVTEQAWRAYGTGLDFLALYRYFGLTHDWLKIRSAIGFGDPTAAKATRSTVTAALLAFSQRFPSESVEGLLDKRVEGFFYLRDAASELLGVGEEEGESLPPGGAIIHDPEKKATIWAAIEKAQVQ